MKCPNCGSKNIQKFGKPRVKVGGRIIKRQRYRCYNCFRTMWGDKE